MKLKYGIFIFIITVLLLTVLSCVNKNRDSVNSLIKLPDSKKQYDLYQWAVINEPLPRLRAEPKEDAEVINYLQIGTVVKILKIDEKVSKFNNDRDHWYYIDYEGEKGWIFGTFLEIFNNYDEVMKRCEEILINDKKSKENENKKVEEKK